MPYGDKYVLTGDTKEVDGHTLHRIEATVTPGNVASVALLTRHGFRSEGLLRGHGYWKGGFQDVEMFARLATD